MPAWGYWGCMYLLELIDCCRINLIVMKIVNYLLIIGTLIVAFSCSDSQLKDTVELNITQDSLRFVIPDDVKGPMLFVETLDDDGKAYLSFKNEVEPEILFYEISSGSLVKRVVYAVEGDNAITGGFMGYHATDFDHIYIPSMYVTTIFITDTTGTVKDEINFSQTDTNQPLIPFIPGLYGTIEMVDGQFYILQTVNPMLRERALEDSPVSVVIDTMKNIVHALPMKFPQLITYKDFGTSAGNGEDYYRCFTGNDFIYSFYYSDLMYKTDIKHQNVTPCLVKSRYIDKVEILRNSSNNQDAILKDRAEQANYGSVLYDKYRKVYYRVAYPASTIGESDNYLKIIRSGKKNFSIMILDEDLNVIGEKLFPDYTFNPHLWFVREDGLYISTNNEMNPSYDENLLVFKRIELNNVE